MTSEAIASWAPIASIVTMPPRTSIFFRSSGIAVISLDFSAQACCPRARPYSPAQAVTTCKGPRSSLASWLRRAVLPSMAMIGRSTHVSATASSRRRAIQALKAASKASGWMIISTRRKTSLPGVPWGRSRRPTRSSSLYLAHRAMAVGPAAPASTARPDGAMWFLSDQERVYRVTTAGVFTGYQVAGVMTGGSLGAITTGPDGALWFTERPDSPGATGKVARLTTAGVLTEFYVLG